MLALVALAMLGTPPSRIDREFGGASVQISAVRAWALLPGRCTTITWDLKGIQSVYVDGQEEAGSGEMIYCPSLSDNSPIFEVTIANGDLETFVLNIRYLPSELVDCLYLAAILSLIILACYFLATERICAPVPFGRVQILSLIALFILCLLCQTGELFSMDSLLNALKRLFTSRAWQGIGLLLAGLVFIPLVVQSLREGLKKRSWEDFAAIGAFFVFVLVLYLPFGFDSIGHWEEWVFRHYLEDSQRQAQFRIGFTLLGSGSQCTCKRLKSRIIFRVSLRQCSDVLGPNGIPLRYFSQNQGCTAVGLVDDDSDSGVSSKLWIDVIMVVYNEFWQVVACDRHILRP